MNRLFLSLMMIFGVCISNLQGYSVQAQSFRNVYSCINVRGKPNTIVNTKRGKIKLIIWESDYFRASGWTPQKRCEEVTRRFQRFSDSGQLKYVITGSTGDYQVICVGKKDKYNKYTCIDNGLLITLEPKDKPEKVLQNIFANATRVGGIATLRGSTTVLDLDDYFAKADLMETTEDNNDNNIPLPDDQNIPPLPPQPPIIKPPIPPETDANPETNTNSSVNDDDQLCPPILCP